MQAVQRAQNAQIATLGAKSSVLEINKDAKKGVQSDTPKSSVLEINKDAKERQHTGPGGLSPRLAKTGKQQPQFSHSQPQCR